MVAFLCRHHRAARKKSTGGTRGAGIADGAGGAGGGLIVPNEWRVKEWKRLHLAPLSLSWGNDANHNVMRHTYATMHVAAFRNPGSTALNLGHGHSLEKLERHYKGLFSRSAAAAYWEIYPAPAIHTTSAAFFPVNP